MVGEPTDKREEVEQKTFEHKFSKDGMSVEWTDGGFKFTGVSGVEDGRELVFSEFSEITKILGEFYMNSSLYREFDSTSTEFLQGMIDFSFLSTKNFDSFRRSLENDAEKNGVTVGSLIDGLPKDEKDKYLIMDALTPGVRKGKNPSKEKVENFIKEKPDLVREFIEYSVRKDLVYPEFCAGSRLMITISTEEMAQEVLSAIGEVITPGLEKLIDAATIGKISDAKEATKSGDTGALERYRQEVVKAYSLLDIDVSQKEFLK